MMIYVRFMRALALMAAIICTAETVAAYGLGNDYRIPATLTAVEIGSYWFFTRWQRCLEDELVDMRIAKARRDALTRIARRLDVPDGLVIDDGIPNHWSTVGDEITSRMRYRTDPSPRPRP